MDAMRGVDLSSKSPVSPFLPAPRLITNRLELDVLTRRDLVALTAFVDRNRARVVNFFQHTQPSITTPLGRALYIGKGMTDARDGFGHAYGIRLTGTQPLIGILEAGISSWTDVDGGEKPFVELGIVMDRADGQGHGYASEATRAVIDATLTTTHAPAIGMRVDPLNTRSLNSVRRLGVEQQPTPEGEPLLFAVTRRGFDAAAALGEVKETPALGN
jgi:RimJ/RimL family protein N-acetyltransferase